MQLCELGLMKKNHFPEKPEQKAAAEAV